LQDTNLLLLDEPTNHLDIPSQEVLQSVLDSYQGTILLVSHDRYLVDELATQIWEINPDESQMIAFNGTYSQMKEERRKIAQLQELENTIAELEATLSNLSSQLESPFVKPDEVRKIGSEYERVQKEMDEKLNEWERMQT